MLVAESRLEEMRRRWAARDWWAGSGRWATWSVYLVSMLTMVSPSNAHIPEPGNDMRLEATPVLLPGPASRRVVGFSPLPLEGSQSDWWEEAEAMEGSGMGRGKREYSLEDFFLWMASGDGPSEEWHHRQRDTSWFHDITTTTVFLTTTVYTTVLPAPFTPSTILATTVSSDQGNPTKLPEGPTSIGASSNIVPQKGEGKDLSDNATKSSADSEERPQSDYPQSGHVGNQIPGSSGSKDKTHDKGGKTNYITVTRTITSPPTLFSTRPSTIVPSSAPDEPTYDYTDLVRPSIEYPGPSATITMPSATPSLSQTVTPSLTVNTRPPTGATSFYTSRPTSVISLGESSPTVSPGKESGGDWGDLTPEMSQPEPATTSKEAPGSEYTAIVPTPAVTEAEENTVEAPSTDQTSTEATQEGSGITVVGSDYDTKATESDKETEATTKSDQNPTDPSISIETPPGGGTELDNGVTENPTKSTEELTEGTPQLSVTEEETSTIDGFSPTPGLPPPTTDPTQSSSVRPLFGDEEVALDLTTPREDAETDKGENTEKDDEYLTTTPQTTEAPTTHREEEEPLGTGSGVPGAENTTVSAPWTTTTGSVEAVDPSPVEVDTDGDVDDSTDTANVSVSAPETAITHPSVTGFPEDGDSSSTFPPDTTEESGDGTEAPSASGTSTVMVATEVGERPHGEEGDVGGGDTTGGSEVDGGSNGDGSANVGETTVSTDGNGVVGIGDGIDTGSGDFGTTTVGSEGGDVSTVTSGDSEVTTVSSGDVGVTGDGSDVTTEGDVTTTIGAGGEDGVSTTVSSGVDIDIDSVFGDTTTVGTYHDVTTVGDDATSVGSDGDVTTTDRDGGVTTVGSDTDSTTGSLNGDATTDVTGGDTTTVGSDSVLTTFSNDDNLSTVGGGDDLTTGGIGTDDGTKITTEVDVTTEYGIGGGDITTVDSLDFTTGGRGYESDGDKVSTPSDWNGDVTTTGTEGSGYIGNGGSVSGEDDSGSGDGSDIHGASTGEDGITISVDREFTIVTENDYTTVQSQSDNATTTETEDGGVTTPISDFDKDGASTSITESTETTTVDATEKEIHVDSDGNKDEVGNEVNKGRTTEIPDTSHEGLTEDGGDGITTPLPDEVFIDTPVVGKEGNSSLGSSSVNLVSSTDTNGTVVVDPSAPVTTLSSSGVESSMSVVSLPIKPTPVTTPLPIETTSIQVTPASPADCFSPLPAPSETPTVAPSFTTIPPSDGKGTPDTMLSPDKQNDTREAGADDTRETGKDPSTTLPPSSDPSVDVTTNSSSGVTDISFPSLQPSAETSSVLPDPTPSISTEEASEISPSHRTTTTAVSETVTRPSDYLSETPSSVTELTTSTQKTLTTTVMMSSSETSQESDRLTSTTSTTTEEAIVTTMAPQKPPTTTRSPAITATTDLTTGSQPSPPSPSNNATVPLDQSYWVRTVLEGPPSIDDPQLFWASMEAMLTEAYREAYRRGALRIERIKQEEAKNNNGTSNQTSVTPDTQELAIDPTTSNPYENYTTITARVRRYIPDPTTPMPLFKRRRRKRDIREGGRVSPGLRREKIIVTLSNDDNVLGIHGKSTKKPARQRKEKKYLRKPPQLRSKDKKASRNTPSFGLIRIKRTTAENLKVRLHNVTYNNVTDTTELIYTVFDDEEPILAREAVGNMTNFDDMEMAILLDQVVVVKAEEYLRSPPPPKNGQVAYWIIAVVIGGVMLIVFIVWLATFVYKRQKREGETLRPDSQAVTPRSQLSVNAYMGHTNLAYAGSREEKLDAAPLPSSSYLPGDDMGRASPGGSHDQLIIHERKDLSRRPSMDDMADEESHEDSPREVDFETTEEEVTDGRRPKSSVPWKRPVRRVASEEAEEPVYSSPNPANIQYQPSHSNYSRYDTTHSELTSSDPAAQLMANMLQGAAEFTRKDQSSIFLPPPLVPPPQGFGRSPQESQFIPGTSLPRFLPPPRPARSAPFGKTPSQIQSYDYDPEAPPIPPRNYSREEAGLPPLRESSQSPARPPMRDAQVEARIDTETGGTSSSGEERLRRPSTTSSQVSDTGSSESSAPNVVRLRRRFHDLLDDAFSLLNGQRHGDKVTPLTTPTQGRKGRVRSAAFLQRSRHSEVTQEPRDAGEEARPWSAAAVHASPPWREPQMVGVIPLEESRNPVSAWGDGTSRARPASAHPTTGRPSSSGRPGSGRPGSARPGSGRSARSITPVNMPPNSPDRLDLNLPGVHGGGSAEALDPETGLRASDPAVPLIRAIKEELKRFKSTISTESSNA